MEKPIKPEKRLEQIERNISDFQRIIKQEILRWDLTALMTEKIEVWKRESKQIKKEIKAKEKKSRKEDSDESDA